MKFRKKMFYTHDEFMDVAVEVVKVQFQDSKKAKLKIRWWNRGWVGKPYDIFLADHKITIKNFRGWKRLNSLERYVG